MTTLKIILDTRRSKSNGTYPIVLRLGHNRKTRNIPLGYDIFIDEWNEDTARINSKHRNSLRLNQKIYEKLTIAEKVTIDHERDIIIQDIKQVKKLIENELLGKEAEPTKQVMFFEFAQVIIDRNMEAKKFGNAGCYKTDLGVFKRYLCENNDIPLHTITYKWLKNFEAHLYGRGISMNGVNRYMRTVRAIMNKAINEMKWSLNTTLLENSNYKGKKQPNEPFPKKTL